MRNQGQGFRGLLLILIVVAWAALSLAGPLPVTAGQSEDRSTPAGIGNFDPGMIYCYGGSGVQIGPADSVTIAGPSTLRFADPDAGEDVLTSEPCIVNLGIYARRFGDLQRSTVQCFDGAGETVYYDVAVSSRFEQGVAVWRTESTGEVYLSTLACRLRRIS